MTEYTVMMRCIYVEAWSVEAASAGEARKLVEALDESVVTDEQGECIDWEITSIERAVVKMSSEKFEQHMETATVIIVVVAYIGAFATFGALLVTIGREMVRALV